ncbi:zinc finger protein 514-like [Entelurus aequoreus]|uniref:zinc finger protein 514-like n=1 Tax=Entelurus aequoreus TaxID=161455 RepID=UPI002B1E2B10|nr:zinc finger protein 514-like [Entelurus aequoreus]
MCKVQKLRALVNQRLAAAVQDIFVEFERTLAEYDEELSRTKEEMERQRQLLDAVFHPEVRVQNADVLQSQEMMSSGVEPEVEPPLVKEEEQEVDVEKFHVKSEEDDKERVEWSQLHQSEAVTSRHGDDGGRHESATQVVQPNGDTMVAFVRGKTDESDKSDVESASLNPNNGLFKCHDCGKTYSRLSDLKRHSQCHAGDRPFSCAFCSYRFQTRSLLERHTRCHTGEKPYSCSLCDSTFSRRSGLQDHMRIHTGEKPFSCLLCHSRFTKRYTLVLHMRTHTGEKPFVCRFCGKAFSQQGVMRIHMRIHTGEKPFGCDACDRRFARKYQLERHHCVGRRSDAELWIPVTSHTSSS